MLQDSLFLDGEGDAWYEPNRDAYHPERDPVIRCLRRQSVLPNSILEIGASRGERLAEIHKLYQAAVTAVDPSKLP